MNEGACLRLSQYLWASLRLEEQAERDSTLIAWSDVQVRHQLACCQHGHLCFLMSWAVWTCSVSHPELAEAGQVLELGFPTVLLQPFLDSGLF